MSKITSLLLFASFGLFVGLGTVLTMAGNLAAGWMFGVAAFQLPIVIHSVLLDHDDKG